MKTACVILNYNDSETAEKQVRRICGYSGLDAVVVVDNCSTDGSGERLAVLEKECPKTVFLRSGRNGGYGAGNNLGVRYAREELGADLVLIANPDTVFSDVCVRNLAGLLSRHPDLAAAAPRMIDPAYGEQLNGWKLTGFWGSLLKTGPVCRRTLGRLLAGRLDYPKGYFQGKKAAYADVLHGSLLMVDARKFLEAGGYDEGVFLYQEEEILARRLKRKGWRSALLLCQTYRHEHSASISKSVDSAMARQRLRHESALYYYRNYLNIGPGRELAARLFFGAILAEIWLCGTVLGMKW